ncbi:hypothetical protein [Pseudomonas aeruginosa]|uniref:hypothetical protein n=1 Tax=Pseudomonas aeruginosa TaxID=287 RepID=UPI003EB980DB
MSNELTDVRCPCGDEFQADSYDAGFIAGSGMCQNCDAALPPKDICTCPSGDGSLVHPCPAHPESVELAGGDERDLQGAQGERECGHAACKSLGEHHPFCKFVSDQDRAALAQPSPAIAAAPTYQFQSREIGESDWAPCDFRWYLYCSKSPEMDTRVVEVAAQPSPAQAEQAEAERPEVVAWQYRVTAGPQTGWSLWHPGKGEEFERSYTVERRPLMTIAQHEYIVGELWAVIAQLRQHKNDYMDSGQETYRALQNEIREREAEIARLDGLVSGRTAERDAALARVAELEKQEPAGAPMPDEIHQMAFEEGQPAEDGDGYLFSAEEFDLFVQRLLDSCAAPVAQPEEMPGEILAAKLIETWVTKHGKPAPWSTAVEITAVATNMPNDERDRLLALDDDVDAQAQHSVPELDALTEAQMRRIYENSTEIENERLGFAAFARLMRRAEAVHQIAAAPQPVAEGE